MGVPSGFFNSLNDVNKLSGVIVFDPNVDSFVDPSSLPGKPGFVVGIEGIPSPPVFVVGFVTSPTKFDGISSV